jgi:hypothetical protein
MYFLCVRSHPDVCVMVIKLGSKLDSVKGVW